MAYAEVFDGVQKDELLGGNEVGIRLYNVKVGANAEIERGDLLCGASIGGAFSLVGSAADASKILTIAAEDYTADSLGGAVTAYSSGVFNRERVRFGAAAASLTADTFENEMRKQNLHLTSIKDLNKE